MPRLSLDGVLLFDKPLGWSSNDAVQRVRRLLRAEKTGHTGTLDPLATGLLPLLFGEATKFSADLLEADKTYQARVRLGSTTTTGDLEGELLTRSEEELTRSVTPERLSGVLAGFLGAQQQVPPMYSALKRDGKALYEYARAGVEIDRPPRDIHISDIRLCDLSHDVLLPNGERVSEFVCEVTCSKGTYIRVLSEDIGKQLGCGAHLSGLRRTAVGHLSLSGSTRVALQQSRIASDAQPEQWAVHTFESLSALASSDPFNPSQVLAPVDALLTSLPSVQLDGAWALRFTQGQRLPLGFRSEQGRVRVYRDAPPALLGTGFLNNDGAGHSLLCPERLIREHHDPRT